MPANHLESLKPYDADYTGRQTDRQVNGVQHIEVEDVLQERDIKYHTEKEKRSTHNPPEGGIRRSQCGKDDTRP